MQITQSRQATRALTALALIALGAVTLWAFSGYYTPEMMLNAVLRFCGF